MTAQRQEWCVGPGVPSDEIPGPHYVAPEWQTVAWFSSYFDARRSAVYVSARCKVCAQIRRDFLKTRCRKRAKARNAITHHAKRYAEKWNCSTPEARRRLKTYGWTVDAVTALLEEADANGSCPEVDACGWAWDFGEHEMTLDVKDPDAAPLLPGNVWIICRTCNVRKRNMRLSQWREFRAYWQWLVAGVPGQLAIPVDS